MPSILMNTEVDHRAISLILTSHLLDMHLYIIPIISILIRYFIACLYKFFYFFCCNACLYKLVYKDLLGQDLYQCSTLLL